MEWFAALFLMAFADYAHWQADTNNEVVVFPNGLFLKTRAWWGTPQHNGRRSDWGNPWRKKPFSAFWPASRSAWARVVGTTKSQPPLRISWQSQRLYWLQTPHSWGSLRHTPQLWGRRLLRRLRSPLSSGLQPLPLPRGHSYVFARGRTLLTDVDPLSQTPAARGL